MKIYEINYKISLTTIADGKVHIGDRIQLKCEGNLSRPSNLIAKASRSDCFLGNSSERAFGTSNAQVDASTIFVIKRYYIMKNRVFQIKLSNKYF